MTAIGVRPDAMSDGLALVRMQGDYVCAAECAAPWSLAFGAPGAHFHIIESGSAWLTLEGAPALRLEAGDLAIAPLGAGHGLASDPAIPAIPIRAAIANLGPSEAPVYRLGGEGEETHLVCGRFTFAGVLAPRLLAVLPPLIHIKGRDGKPLEWLRLTSHFLIEETRHPSPGSAIMIARLLDLLFIQALRQWGAASPRNLGWLSGLRDAAVGRALSAIHETPAAAWTVAALADIAGLSRSAFASRFLNIVGQPPLKYLAAWRLDLAADHLRGGSAKIGQIAAAVGYGSEAALTRAFKTRFGVTPGAFRQTGG
jgi:AraC-like DNA-binding protein